MSQKPRNDLGDAGGYGETKERRNAILTENNPLGIIEQLPPSVFPVACRFGVSRGRTHDQTDEQYRQPSYPADLHHSAGVYIPETTVHFDNPAQRPPDGEVAWRPDDFEAKLQEMLEKTDTLAEEDITLSRFEVVEVPQHLVIKDSETGDYAVKKELYEDEYEMAIARFLKHNSLSAARVRNQIADALPGESRTPARLTDLISVTAKPARHGSHTQARSGRDRYYTESEADKTGELNRTPAHYQSRYLNRETERTRPLGPAISKLEEFVPELVQKSEELVRVVKFIGHEEQKQSFVATEVLE